MALMSNTVKATCSACSKSNVPGLAWVAYEVADAAMGLVQTEGLQARVGGRPQVVEVAAAAGRCGGQERLRQRKAHDGSAKGTDDERRLQRPVVGTLYGLKVDATCRHSVQASLRCSIRGSWQQRQASLLLLQCYTSGRVARHCHRRGTRWCRR